jgi:hypothetical protein
MQDTASKGHEDGRDSAEITVSTIGNRKEKPWVPIAKGGSAEAEVPTQGVVFAEVTHFNKKKGNH